MGGNPAPRPAPSSKTGRKPKASASTPSSSASSTSSSNDSRRARHCGSGLVGEQRRAFAHRRAALGAQADPAARRAGRELLRGSAAAPGKPPARAPPARRLFWIDHSARLPPAWSRRRCRGRRGKARLRAEGCRGRQARRASRCRRQQRAGERLGLPRPGPKSRSRPRRYSPSARRSSRCRRPHAARHP